MKLGFIVLLDSSGYSIANEHIIPTNSGTNAKSVARSGIYVARQALYGQYRRRELFTHAAARLREKCRERREYSNAARKPQRARNAVPHSEHSRHVFAHRKVQSEYRRQHRERPSFFITVKPDRHKQYYERRRYRHTEHSGAHVVHRIPTRAYIPAVIEPGRGIKPARIVRRQLYHYHGVAAVRFDYRAPLGITAFRFPRVLAHDAALAVEHAVDEHAVRARIRRAIHPHGVALLHVLDGEPIRRISGRGKHVPAEPLARPPPGHRDQSVRFAVVAVGHDESVIKELPFAREIERDTALVASGK